MTDPEYMAEVNIEIPYTSLEVPEEALDDLFDSLADVLYTWAEDRSIDPFMSGAYKNSPPKWLSETEGPPQESLACEADYESTEDGEGESLYIALFEKFKGMGFSWAVSDDLADRAEDVVRAREERRKNND